MLIVVEVMRVASTSECCWQSNKAASHKELVPSYSLWRRLLAEKIKETAEPEVMKRRDTQAAHTTTIIIIIGQPFKIDTLANVLHVDPASG